MENHGDPGKCGGERTKLGENSHHSNTEHVLQLSHDTLYYGEQIRNEGSRDRMMM